MHEMNIGEIQKASLDVLKKLHQICENQGITYWIMYGTLIGAVRHKGYIPWDDDVDIALPRPDYEKLISYLQHHSQELLPYKLDNYLNTSNYPFYISRFTDTRYLLKFNNKNYQSGVFVDLYPFDGIGDKSDLEKWEKSQKKIKLLNKHLTLACFPGFLYGNSLSHKLLNLPNMLYSKIVGRKYFLKKMDSISKKFSWEESQYVGVPAWEDVAFEKQLFDVIDLVEYEDTIVRAPRKFDEILTKVYGDYMQLPPEEKRVATHEYKAYSDI